MSDNPRELGEYDDAPMDDEDNPEWTEEDFARAVPISQAPKSIRRAFSGPGRRALPVSERKRQVTLRLSPEVVDFFKAGGKGWQTRIDETLRRAIKSR